MATLVLTAVGSIFGGPLGGAVGAILGQQFDQRVLLKPKGRQGPRLGDLAVQTSSYGTAIPKLFGTMRVAGTVIWATDLIEHRKKSGGGKGRPKVTTYSYSVSFAVALSARPIRAIRRIWADGKLLRGAAGDFKTETGFRLWKGDEDAGADPLIASIEGGAQTPAYRGIAYVVFENFQLADYGNRIPMLTFEVEADAGPVPIAAIARELSGGAITGAEGRRIGGYAASGDSVRGAVETLAIAAPLAIMDDGAALVLNEGAAATRMIARAAMGAAAKGHAPVRARRLGDALTIPDEIILSYYEPSRDYQAGLHRARRDVRGRRAERIELPAALSATEAKAIAEAHLARAWTARNSRTLYLPWGDLDLAPGMAVRIEGEPGLWRVRQAMFENMSLSLDLTQIEAGALPDTGAEAGRPVRAADLIHGPTILNAFELPDMGESPATAPRIFVAAAGREIGWRSAALAFSIDDGARWTEAGGTAAPATMGEVRVPPGDGTSWLFDDYNWLEISLLNDGMMLNDADDAQLLGGANLALIGNELIQFGTATPLGGSHYRLSRLLRGRGGTEFAMTGHVAGETFVLVESETMLPIELPVSALGAQARFLASGVGDPVAATVENDVRGISMMPPSPVALSGERMANGDLKMRWTRRSRLGWRWIDGIDAPLGEESEAYRIAILRNGNEIRIFNVSTPQFIYPHDAEAADRSGGANLHISVAQIGTHGASHPGYFLIEPS